MVANQQTSNLKVHAALVLACLALLLAGYAAFRDPGRAVVPAAQACVDQEARARVDRLLAQRDLGAVPSVPTAPGSEVPAVAAPPRAPQPQPEPGPRIYARFEIPNPAVTVTQKSDGTYDIRTTDPTLAGSVMQVTAVTKSGEEQKLLIRIP